MLLPSQPMKPSEHLLISIGLGASLLVTLYYGLIALNHAFSAPYVVQDDVRQHIVWMQQLVDPKLFPNDWIAEYFQSLAPTGFRALFVGMAALGVAPLGLAKVLPLLLGIITTIYCFHGFLLLLPSPTGAFLSTLILNQSIWLDDDLVSATPRAFVYPIFAAFLYYLLRRSRLPCLVTIGLQSLFFPQLALVQVGVLMLALVQWQGNRWQFSQQRDDYLFCSLGMGVVLIGLLPYVHSSSPFGEIITAEQMRVMPEFGLQGRNEYFGVHPLDFWFNGDSGLRLPLFPSVSLLGLALPWMWGFQVGAMQHVSKRVRVLADVFLASLLLYGLAHLFLLRLYFPSRYTYHSLRVVLSLSAAIVLTILLNAAWQTLQPKLRGDVPFFPRDRRRLEIIGAIIAIVTIVPFIPLIILVFQNWKISEIPAFHKFLATQPKSALVASLADEADNVPAFALRSILVGREFALALHPIYYQKLQQRAIDLVRLQYSPDLQVVQQVINQYSIDWIWVEQDAFQPNYLRAKDWLIHSSFQATTLEAIYNLEQGKVPAIVQSLQQCAVVEAQRSTLLDAHCVQSPQAGMASTD